MNVDLDPVLFSLGPLQVRWYGLMYVCGFLVGVRMLSNLCRQKFLNLVPEKADLVMTYLLIGMFIFARLFYVVVYNWDETNSILDAIAVWKGGLSFHGAAIGFFLAAYLFSKRHNVSFWALCDSIVLCTCPGLGFGRIGNFINMELYGRETDVPWGMVFASDKLGLVRHPSQLYQAIGEGLIVGFYIWYIKKKTLNYGVVFANFFIAYGVVRYVIEFFREADSQLGYYLGGTTTMGQILCFGMILIGVGLVFYHRNRNEAVPQYSVDEIKQFVKESYEREQSLKEEASNENGKKNSNKKNQRNKKKRKKSK